MPSMKDGRICRQLRWRKVPVLVTVMAVTLSFLLATMAILITASGTTSGPLLLTPFLDNNDTRRARDLSRVQCDGIPDSHSGFITVNKTLGNHLFFWFFPKSAEDDNSSAAPLLLWLNGGPGMSSMLGLFWENGPLEIVPGNGDSEPTVKGRCATWAKHYSIVYVDNPVGVGFSFSDSGHEGFRTTQDGYGEDLHSFVKQFFKMFPEYYWREFYVGGQSYAGRYVPALAIRLHDSLQEGAKEQPTIPLTGIYLGAPYFDCSKQMKPFFEYLYTVGAISFAEKNNYQNAVTSLYQSFLDGKNDKMTLSDIFQRLVPPDIGLKSVDNYVTGKEPDHASIDKLLNSQKFRKLLQVGDFIYSVSSNEFFDLYSQDVFVSTTDKLAVLMDHYKVLIYTGDYDVVVNSRMVDEALMLTPWSRQQEFNESFRKPWKLNGNLLGFYSKTNRFCRVIVHGAGHQVPHDQPNSALAMMTHFIEYGCILEDKQEPFNCETVRE